MSQTLPFYQIDAFAERIFEGNQACVMPLEEFFPDETLQAIAAENNVAETAFVVPAGEGCWELRWFTPAVEVPLCGHATLASAHVIFTHLGYNGTQVTFQTRYSGELFVTRKGEGYEMDFPASPVKEIAVTDEMEAALGARPVQMWAGSFLACRFDTPEDVIDLAPDHKALCILGADDGDWERGNIGCFAMGGADGVDVTSRFFAPGSGIDEDPATGSWHCMLAPVVAERYTKTSLKCFQAFAGRGAWIGTELVGDRVKLSGQAVTVIEGKFTL
ncbi:MAG: PhzF family phenazine biosynthesis protein [Hyphomonadaceae bacterium]